MFQQKCLLQCNIYFNRKVKIFKSDMSKTDFEQIPHKYRQIGLQQQCKSYIIPALEKLKIVTKATQ